MKMRTRGNSLRLRLTQTEVAQFAETNLVEEIIEFGNGQKLIYALESNAQIETPKAEFANNRIVISIPERQARTWANSTETGIEAEQIIGGEKTLRRLIEKDYACLEQREGEDDADTFPHPRAGKAC